MKRQQLETWQARAVQAEGNSDTRNQGMVFRVDPLGHEPELLRPLDHYSHLSLHRTPPRLRDVTERVPSRAGITRRAVGR